MKLAMQHILAALEGATMGAVVTVSKKAMLKEAASRKAPLIIPLFSQRFECKYIAVCYSILESVS